MAVNNDLCKVCVNERLSHQEMSLWLPVCLGINQYSHNCGDKNNAVQTMPTILKVQEQKLLF